MATKTEKIQVNGDDLADLVDILADIRKQLGIKKEPFAVALTFAAKHICDELGIEVVPVPEVDEELH